MCAGAIESRKEVAPPFAVSPQALVPIGSLDSPLAPPPDNQDEEVTPPRGGGRGRRWALVGVPALGLMAAGAWGLRATRPSAQVHARERVETRSALPEEPAAAPVAGAPAPTPSPPPAATVAPAEGEARAPAADGS